ncbi:DUF4097 domain-containing protein [Terrisporobacter petrolearius]|uniref:DUF4097 family beta strand repeat-containing protein n=2 Tax=Terrisporobacter petrolearius TaxID=1460447 RepID=UPI00292EEA50|nr:DUF4097 family beta strand repeat-containing protein [Terrisporobacter petrolearius]MCC3866149.1 DUF4097 domain-containing protein [Terrisporobacter petrolearius]
MMNKKLSIFAIVLIVVGLIGTVWSGFFSMPYFINKLQDFDEQVNMEKTIYEKNIDVEELNINTNYVNTKIVKSNTNKIVVKSRGLYENRDIQVRDNDKILSVKEVDKNLSMGKIKSVDDFTSKILENAFSNHTNMITIYVPKDINLKVISKSGSLTIENDIFLNEFSFETYSGSLSLPNEVKNLNKLSISSQNYVSLQLGEILGIKEVNIYSNDVYIESDKYNLEDIEKYLPNKVTIKSNNLDNININIESNLPISKNLTIDGYKSEVNLNLPLDRYKFKFDIKAYENIVLNEFLQRDFNDENDYDLKEFKKTINKDLKNEYKVNIQATNIYFN